MHGRGRWVEEGLRGGRRVIAVGELRKLGGNGVFVVGVGPLSVQWSGRSGGRMNTRAACVMTERFELVRSLPTRTANVRKTIITSLSG